MKGQPRGGQRTQRKQQKSQGERSVTVRHKTIISAQYRIPSGKNSLKNEDEMMTRHSQTKQLENFISSTYF